MAGRMRIAVMVMIGLIASPSSAAAEKLIIEVNGMVCSFCAQGITKKFSSHPSVADVQVSLEKKKVEIATKENTTLSDEEATKLIKDAGYAVVAIERQ